MSQPLHYPHRQPFLTFGPDQTLRVRQATEQGYAVCPVGCACDLSYPTSTLRRARVVRGGKIVPALTSQGETLYVWLGIDDV